MATAADKFRSLVGDITVVLSVGHESCLVATNRFYSREMIGESLRREICERKGAEAVNLLLDGLSAALEVNPSRLEDVIEVLSEEPSLCEVFKKIKEAEPNSEAPGAATVIGEAPQVPSSHIDPNIVVSQLQDVVQCNPDAILAVNDLCSKFDDLFTSASTSLQHVKLDELKLPLESKLARTPKVVKDRFCPLLREISSVSQFFSFILEHKFCGFLNFNLLSIYINRFGSETLKLKMSEYKTFFRSFSKAIKMQELLNSILKNPNLPKPLAPIGLPMAECLLEESWFSRSYNSFLEVLSSVYSWSISIMFNDIREKCIIVDYALFGEEEMERIFEDINSSEKRQLLKECGITVTLHTQFKPKNDDQRQSKSRMHKLEESVTCSLCKGLFKDPKVLSSHHSLCLACLERVHATEAAQKSLNIENLSKVLTLLRKGGFNGDWQRLGLELGLLQPTLSAIQAKNSDNLRECIVKWLERADDVDDNGGANYISLARALIELDQRNTADYICSECQLDFVQEDSVAKKRKVEPDIIEERKENRKEVEEEEKEEEEEGISKAPSPVTRDKVTDRKNKEQMETDFFWSSSRKIYKYEKSKQKNRGIALIINNVEFDPDTKLAPRESSNEDAKRLKGLFKDLKYDVHECSDLTAAAMTGTLKMYAKDAISETNDSFICCIVSHGDERGVFGTDGEVVSIEELASSFNGRNCPKLNGKPKIFFIQACRGENTPAAVFKFPSKKEKRMVTDDGKQSRALPPDADFLFGFSTTDSTKSMRGVSTGSQYIKELCSVIKENASGLSIDEILLIVHNNVARNCFEGMDYQQMPKTRSTLRGKFYFK